ncbi:hypothetical protein V5O48_002100 [Marasmius crinis-equi]|uniref:Uncharacterized protein n=1 Tax=Marasmius crinis-equi TaxID=585013 RepID=A0ABR3FWM5_9AGAR
MHKQGLDDIISRSSQDVNQEEIARKAKLFYFNRIAGSALTLEEIEAYERGAPVAEAASSNEVAAGQTNGASASSDPKEKTAEDSEVLTLAQIKELIETGRTDELPNNKVIPGGLNEQPPTQSVAPSRKKPWEAKGAFRTRLGVEPEPPPSPFYAQRNHGKLKLMAQNAHLYGDQRQPISISSSSESSSNASSVASSSTSATSSASSVPSKTPRGKGAHRAIVISSDEEDDDEPSNSRTPQPSTIDKPKFPTPALPIPKSNVLPGSFPVDRPSQQLPYQPRFSGPATPIAIPSLSKPTPPHHYPSGSRPAQPPRIVQPQERRDGDGEYVEVPDFAQDENMFTSPQEAEKALRDLMGGSMNDEGENIEFTEEDALVSGFKEEFRLLPHQIIGRRFMKDREDPKAKRMGGILADDMGLGKTIQTLTRIVEGRPKKSDKEDGWSPTTLVVCPLALVSQWADEIKRMTEGLVVIKHQGTSRTSNPNELRKAHVVITTYDTLKSEYGTFDPSSKGDSKSSKAKTKKSAKDASDSDSSEGETFGRIAKKSIPKGASKAKKDALFRVRWFRVVLDEAHNIKNRLTAAAKACYALEAKFRWCLTGTPMQVPPRSVNVEYRLTVSIRQNDVAELYSLIKFLRIKPFNEWERFNETIAKPVKSGKGANRAMKRLQVVLKNIMLRRKKDDKLNGKVLVELPKRIVNVVSCDFSESEQQFYSELEGKMNEVLDKLNADAQKSGKAQASYISVLLLLLRLRQACNHPVLVSNDYKADLDAVESKAAKTNDVGDADADDLVAAFGQLGVTKKCQVCTVEITSANSTGRLEGHCDSCATLTIQTRSELSIKGDSAKIRMILKLLGKVDQSSGGSDKTIIFSQFTSMLDLVEPWLKSAGYRFVRYDGTMKPQQREETLNAIKTNPSVRVILISFKAGSTGLNLTCCNNVILVDLWWNPALEDQAFDRSHRFGQKKDVNIYKLKVDETVEDRILELQEKKRELARAALSGDKIKNMRLGMDDLLALFRPGRDDADDDDN